MNKLMCRFVTTTKKKKLPNPNLDTVCPAGIPCNYTVRNSESKTRSKVLFRDTKITVTIKERLGEPYLIGKH